MILSRLTILLNVKKGTHEEYFIEFSEIFLDKKCIFIKEETQVCFLAAF